MADKINFISQETQLIDTLTIFKLEKLVAVKVLWQSDVRWVITLTYRLNLHCGRENYTFDIVEIDSGYR